MIAAVRDGFAGGAVLTRARDAFLEAERERLILWLPVAYGVGIAVYFCLGTEPSLWHAAAAVAVSLAVLAAVRHTVLPLLLCAALALGAAGFSVAKVRTDISAAPVLARATVTATVAGRVIALETRGRGRRVVLDRVELPGASPEQTPERVRVRLHPDDRPVLGQRIAVRARLRPPPGPALPGGYDFQRRAFFERLGAVGFAFGTARPVPAIAPTGPADRLAFWIGGVRQRINRQIRAALPGESGAVAMALVTGERGAIPQAVLEDVRAAGLAHLLAISGLHLGLVCGLIFGALRLLLASIEPLALRFAIKKWAAWAALAGGFAYLLLAGGTVPTQRAFIMTGVVLIAVIADRRALSMRMVACAAMIVLTLRPESLLGASFQMSFAAVVALIAAYEALTPRLPFAGRPMPLPLRLLAYLGGIALTTLIAGSATSLFALHHFGRVSSYSMLANLIAIPVTAVWIMPAGIASVLAMPFGLEGVPLAVMGGGIDLVLGLAARIADWPGAERAVPTLSAAAMATAALGGLWLCLWQSPLRLAGTAGPVLALASLLWTAPPDLLVSEDGRLVAVRDEAGRMFLSDRRIAAWTARTWLERSGLRSADVMPVPGAAGPDAQLRCDRAACLFNRGQVLVSVVQRAEALAEDCRVADVVVARMPVRQACPARLVIDRFDLARRGAHAVWIGAGDSLRVQSVAAYRGARPWVAR